MWGERRYEFLPNWKKVRAQNNNKQRGKKMKVKIKGLVFVGFAAAVFAQSAMAANPSYQTSANTVTSKKYVDEKFQPFADRVEIGTGTGQYASTSVEGFPWTENDKYPSMKVLKEVKDTLDAVDVVSGNETYVSVTEGTGNNAGTFTVNTAQAPATTNAGITGNLTQTTQNGSVVSPGTEDALVTAKAVKSLIDTSISGTENDTTVPTSLAVQTYAEATANKLAEDSNALGTTTITQANAEATDGNTKFPTVRNVYDFVKAEGGNYQRKLTSSEGALYIGKWDGTLNNGAGDSTWKALEAVSSNDQASTDYVTIKADSNGVYQVNIPAAQIATTAALTGATATNDTGLVTAGSIRSTILQAGSTAGGTIASAATAQSNNTSDETVPTTKNVYEFVTNYAQDTYQPIVPDGQVTNFMVGYKATSGGVSAWKSLIGTQYVSVANDVETGEVKVAVPEAMIASQGSDITAATGTSTGSDYNNDLTTARAVHEYVNTMMGGLEIPGMPSECSTAAASGHYCALVYGQTGESGGTATYGLMWTIMAPES
jgi:hypothetical protein